MLLSRTSPAALLLLAACGSAAPPLAETGSTTPVASASAAAVTQNEAQRAYAAANDRMHADMGTIDPDPDVAFVQGMIPHHRGAVEMAEIVLKHGKDAETRALASRIIAAQREEITEMEAWLAKHGASPAAAAPAGEHHGH